MSFISTHPTYQTIIATAPGSLMLTGEHAVLYGHPALVCALNQRMKVSLTPRSDTIFTIHSPRLGNYEGDITSISISSPFQFVTTIIKHFESLLPSGFSLSIESDFSHQVGLGSSAAVVVATMAVFLKWLKKTYDQTTLFNESYAIVKHVQGVGSGADVAASVWGGIQLYQVDSALHSSLSPFPAISLIYSGAKTPTVNVIQIVQENSKKDPELYQRYFNQIGEYTLNAAQAIKVKNLKLLGKIFNQHYELQKEMHLSTPLINELIQSLKSQPFILGVKISGSGLGDCIIGIGEIPTHTFPLDEAQRKAGVLQLNVKIDSRGVEYE